MWIVRICEIGYLLFDSSPTIVVFEDTADPQRRGGTVSWDVSPSCQTLQLIVAQTWDTGAVQGANTGGVTKQTKRIAQKPSPASSVIADNWMAKYYSLASDCIIRTSVPWFQIVEVARMTWRTVLLMLRLTLVCCSRGCQLSTEDKKTSHQAAVNIVTNLLSRTYL